MTFYTSTCIIRAKSRAITTSFDLLTLPTSRFYSGIFIIIFIAVIIIKNLKSKVSIMKSYSSPFELVSDDADEISNLELKANMMIAIRSLIEGKGWSQSDAAKELGVSQPRISNLKNGKIDKFSVDMLMELLVKLGFRFEFNYTAIKDSLPKLSMNVAAA